MSHVYNFANKLGYRMVVSQTEIKWLVHSQEYRVVPMLLCALQNELAFRNILSILKHILFHFLKPPCDTLLCY